MAMTREEFAGQLGVSTKTVSRAFSAPTQLAGPTLQRVLAHARETGYTEQPNRAAQTLIGQRYGKRTLHGCIGFPCAFDADTPFNDTILNGIQRAALSHGLALVLLPALHGPGWERVDGIVTLNDNRGSWHERLFVSMPVVHILDSLPGYSAVVADDFGGGREATDYLIQLGHRRIGYLTDYRPFNHLLALRLAGYRAALAVAGIQPEAAFACDFSTGPKHFWNGRERMRGWLKSGWHQARLSALLVQNDEVALGAIEALEEAGIRVPGDVSVIGFDGVYAHEQSQLTTVAVPFDRICERAVRLLLQQLGSEEELQPEVVTLPVELLVRGTTRPL